jgi:hypothetical protein
MHNIYLFYACLGMIAAMGVVLFLLPGQWLRVGGCATAGGAHVVGFGRCRRVVRRSGSYPRIGSAGSF